MEKLNYDNISPSEAVEIQRRLVKKLHFTDNFSSPCFIAGIDVGYSRERAWARCAAVVLTYPGLEFTDNAVVEAPVTFPYIPGLLSFREIPIMLDVINKLHQKPDIIICDGQGMAHPRRMGIACHLGIVTGYTTIGAAKK